MSYGDPHLVPNPDGSLLCSDIEDILAELIKKSGGFLGRGSKFGGLDSEQHS